MAVSRVRHDLVTQPPLPLTTLNKRLEHQGQCRSSSRWKSIVPQGLGGTLRSLCLSPHACGFLMCKTAIAVPGAHAEESAARREHCRETKCSQNAVAWTLRTQRLVRSLTPCSSSKKAVDEIHKGFCYQCLGSTVCRELGTISRI